MNFIKEHLIKKIKDQIKKKQDSVNLNGFFYFDQPIKELSYNKKSTFINRVDRVYPYESEKIIPLSWSLNGATLVDIFHKVKNDEFFFYKNINGKDHKIRFKRNATKT